MALRGYRLDEALEDVILRMSLRRPQRKSLEEVHSLFKALPGDLPLLSREQVVGVVREERPYWAFSGDFPDLTFELATGVGKTRLIGAIAAYLFRSGQSKNFLILAPRRAILRKMVENSAPGSSKYLFVDPSLVPNPEVVHAGNFESFRPVAEDADEDRPTVFIFSPQSFTGGDRRVSRESDFSAVTLTEHLAGLDDLVVFMDEAHHLGSAGDEESTLPAWTEAIRNLQPRFRFDMTATPQEHANVAYSYDLSTCLREKLYTKDVRIIVRERSQADGMSDRDWDHHTLDFAIERLASKQREILELDADTDSGQTVQPVLLVCAEDTAHADEVGEWLCAERGFDDSEVLVVHSNIREGRRRKRASSLDEELETTIERLVGIERPDSRVRVVVNVYALTEGWDVTNVYVIAPLRRMGTFQGAIQTMGRGLRLPFGRRLDRSEVDTLDVLCFGSQSLENVLADALREYGSEEDQDSSVEVGDATGSWFEPPERKKLYRVDVANEVDVEMLRVSTLPPEPDLEFDVTVANTLPARGAVEFDLARREVGGTAEVLKYDFDVFVRLVAARVLKRLPYLSEPMHRKSVEGLCGRALVELEFSRDQPIGLDWARMAEVIANSIDKPYRRKDVEVAVTPGASTLSFPAFDWRVPESFDSAIPQKSVSAWSSSLSRLPISGWSRCAHHAAAFDSKPEYGIACILDSARDVAWWARNDPARFKLSTPIGFYEPDFVFERSGAGDGARLIVLEVKDATRWRPPDSDPRIKARSADAWCRSVSEYSSDATWEHWVVLDADVEDARSIDDLAAVQVRDAHVEN